MKKMISCADENLSQEDIMKSELVLLKDDFDYIIAGIERATRQGKYSEAILIVRDLEEAFEAAIMNISDLQDGEN